MHAHPAPHLPIVRLILLVSLPSATTPAQIVPPPGLPPAGFLPPATVGVAPAGGGFPWDIAVFDFNGDAVPDLATADYGSGTVSFAAGVPGPSPSYVFISAVAVGQAPNLSAPMALAPADFDGDGDQDLAVLCRGLFSLGVPSSLEILVNAGGTFTPAVPAPAIGILPGSYSPQALAIGDVDGNGTPDVAVVTVNSVAILVTPAGGLPTAAGALAVPPLSQPTSVALADVTGDGFRDLVIAGFVNAGGAGPSNVTLAPNTGLGTFTLGPSTPVPASLLVGITLADLDGDGFLDAAATGLNQTFICSGGGAAGFTFATAIPIGFGGANANREIETLLLDPDARPDLVVPADDASFSVIRNLGALAFAVEGPFFLGPPGGLSLAIDASTDVSGDSVPDIAVVRGQTRTAGVFVNATALQAWAADAGGGCGPEVLFVSPLRFGAPPLLSLTFGPPNAFLSVVIAPAPPAAVNPFPFACPIWVFTPAAVIALSAFTDPSGLFAFVGPPLAATPALAGAQVAVQVVVANPASLNPIPYDVSNAVVTSFGF